MRVSAVRCSETSAGLELSGDLSGFRLFYRFASGGPGAVRGDAFLPPALLVSMLLGEALEFDGDARISPRLLSGVDTIQDVLGTWDPRFRRVAVRAVSEPGGSRQAGVAAFFSGGLDGAYTLARHASEITHLVFLRGSDIPLERREPLFAAALRRNREVAGAYGKELVVVETNALSLGRRAGVDPFIFYGAILAGAALALGFPRTYVGAGQTYAELWPAGAHLLLDPHWATEGTGLVHAGAEASRTAKLRELGSHPSLLRALRVCLSSEDYNCGRCEKCLRTMLALRLLGLRSESLPALGSLRAVRELRLGDDAELSYWRDNYAASLEAGDAEAAAAIRGLLRRYLVHRTLRQIADLYSHRWLARAYRRWRAPGDEPVRRTAGFRGAPGKAART